MASTAASLSPSSSSAASSSSNVVRSISGLGFPYSTPDPFLFCVYHHDKYPAGNPNNMNAPRSGNGADFDWSKPYRMYHGDRIPGFPQHPHRGFETLTLVLEGTCDHSDSLGAAGRYGGDGRSADMQWMTAGSGCVHGENFPLVHTSKPNTLRLFQIWLNLPSYSKMSPPSYEMYWAENMKFKQGENGAECQIATGYIGEESIDKLPPSNSWAAKKENDVGVFYITLPPNGGAFTLPPANYGKDINRMAYVVDGSTQRDSGIYVGGRLIEGGRASVELSSELSCRFENRDSSKTAEILILQGRPIKEPVAQRGPFVMNTQSELLQASIDYQRTQFGGWPWPEDAVVFPRTEGRFADFVINGKKVREYPPNSSKKDAIPHKQDEL